MCLLNYTKNLSNYQHFSIKKYLISRTRSSTKPAIKVRKNNDKAFCFSVKNKIEKNVIFLYLR